MLVKGPFGGPSLLSPEWFTSSYFHMLVASGSSSAWEKKTLITTPHGMARLVQKEGPLVNPGLVGLPELLATVLRLSVSDRVEHLSLIPRPLTEGIMALFGMAWLLKMRNEMRQGGGGAHRVRHNN